MSGNEVFQFIGLISIGILVCSLIAFAVVYSVYLKDRNYLKKIQESSSNKNSDRISDSDMEARLQLLLTLNEKGDVVNRIYSILDQLIERAANRYIILNVITDPEAYINSKESDRLYKYIFASVKRNMSPEMIALLKLVNNIQTMEDLDDVINIEVKLHVLSIVVSKNTPI